MSSHTTDYRGTPSGFWGDSWAGPSVAAALAASFNFGDDWNHLVGYLSPVPVTASEAVVATLELVCLEAGYYFPEIGPAVPSSIPGTPVIVDGADPDILLAVEPVLCGWWPGFWGTAWIDASVVANQERSFSAIKQLFR